MQAALTGKSVEPCKGAGVREPCLHNCYLITDGVNETTTSNSGTIKRIALKLIQKSGKCLRRGTLAIGQVHRWEQLKALSETTACTPVSMPISSLCIQMVFILSPSPSVTLVIFLIHFPSPLIPPGVLRSLIQLSSFSFQFSCFSTPSFCEKEIRDRSKDNQTSFYSLPLISLSLAPLISPHVCSPLLHSLSFPRVDLCYQSIASSPKHRAQKRQLASSTVLLSYLGFPDSPNVPGSTVEKKKKKKKKL